MLSKRATIIKSILRVSASAAPYSRSIIPQMRRRFDRLYSIALPSHRHKVQLQTIAGIRTVVAIPPHVTHRTIIYIHGGGFIMGSSRAYRQHIKRLARLCHAHVYSIDYSLAPESPYPIALDEIQKIWETLVTNRQCDPLATTIMGDSAGGNLVLASLLRFRDKGLPLPACAALLSPSLDMTLSGASFSDPATRDPILSTGKIKLFVKSYSGAHPKQDPLLSPIFATLTGLPPLLVHVGTDELLFSDSQTIIKNAQRDGVDANLYVGEGMWHDWHLSAAYVPEARRAMEDIAQFITSHTA